MRIRALHLKHPIYGQTIIEVLEWLGERECDRLVMYITLDNGTYRVGVKDGYIKIDTADVVGVEYRTNEQKAEAA